MVKLYLVKRRLLATFIFLIFAYAIAIIHGIFLDAAISKIKREMDSHVFMSKQTANRRTTTVVFLHKEIDVGTLVEIIRQSKLSRDECLRLL